MTNRELKKNLKKVFIIFGILMLLICILLINVLSSSHAELSVYTNSENIDSLKILGINENEFKKYLSAFVNLANTDKSDEENSLRMAIHYIKDMYPSNIITENEKNIYDANFMKNVVQELEGKYLEKKTIGDIEYNAENDSFSIQNQVEEKPYCIDILEVNKKDEGYEVVYNYSNLTEEQINLYEMGQEVQLDKYTISAMVMENKNYEYAKYYIKDIVKK